MITEFLSLSVNTGRGTFSLMSPVEQCQSSLERSKVSAVIKGAVVDIKPPFGQSIFGVCYSKYQLMSPAIDP